MKNTDPEYSIFNILFTKYYAKLCAYAKSFVQNSQISEDLVQDVFVNVWINRKALILNDGLKPYLYRAVQNNCLYYLRQQKASGGQENYRIEYKLQENELIPAALYLFPDDPTQRSEIQRLYSRSLNLLSVKTRTIFLLSRESGLKNLQIAEKLGLSLKSVEYHISRALKVFRKTMRDYYVLFLFLN